MIDKDELHAYFAALGKKGGQKTKEKHGPDYYKKISKKAVASRWGER